MAIRPLLALLLAPLLAACAGTAVAPEQSPEALSAATPTPSPTPAFAEPGDLPPLTLDGVFPPRKLSSLRLDPKRIRTLIATGDVIPARWVDKQIRDRGNDFAYPLSATADILRAADLTVINLEAPLVEGCQLQEAGTFTFCGLPGFAAALQAAGVDVATLENNHIGNWGYEGIDETVARLEAARIKWADRDDAAVMDVRGLKFGFLAFNGVGEVIDRQVMAAQIRALRPDVDVLAVAFHWGTEYVSVPAPGPGIAEDDPVEIGHLAVDAGADLVIGNHPHWVQAVEVYKGKPALSGAEGFIAYAHGNFIFDQMWSYETRVGVIGKYTFYDDTLVAVQFTPVLIEDYAQPVPLKGADAQAVLGTMKSASEELAAR